MCNGTVHVHYNPLTTNMQGQLPMPRALESSRVKGCGMASREGGGEGSEGHQDNLRG